MKKRILVDGSNLSQIHFAANPALDVNGNPAGVIKGFLGAIKHINKFYQPNEIVAFFDGPGGSAQRRAAYKEYKAGRKARTNVGQQYQFTTEAGAKQNYDWQISALKELLLFCGINCITTEDFESDDGIAYLVKSNLDDEHLIVSCDKDFYQLLSSKTSIYNPIMKKIIDAEWLLKKYEIHPNNWLFYRAINGDPSDNLNGVRGFGPKTIKKLFHLNKESKLELDTISESLSLFLLEEKLSAKEKRILEKFRKLNQNIDIIERNWRLMDLKEPMLSLYHKQSLEHQLETFNPTLSQKNFYIEMTKLGLGINPSMPNEFIKLKNKE